MQDQPDLTDNRQYPTRPIVAVGVAVLQGDKCLLIKRGKSPRKGEWSLPGGKQELGETMKECAIREVSEETGLNIKLLGLIDTADYIERDPQDLVVTHYSLIDYAARVIDGELSPATDAVDAKFLDLAEIKSLALWPETQRIIAAALDRFGRKS